MTDRELMQQGYEVPLVEQLDAVPRDARLWIEDSDGMGSRHFPIGLMCHKAAEALRAKLSAPEPEPVAWVPVHPKNGPLWSMTTDAPSPERLPNYSLMSLYPAPLSTPDSANRSADSAGAFCNQEPVAWLHRFIEHGISIGKKPVDLDKYPDRWMPVYADPTPCQTCEALARTVMMDQTSHDTPPQREWQGLTDEERESIASKAGYNPLTMTVYEYRVIIQKETEAKLREKNGNL
jgi:hypothetical protein